jgi:hypothetical protein
VKNLQEVMASALHGEGEREDGGELATRQVLFARFVPPSLLIVRVADCL